MKLTFKYDDIIPFSDSLINKVKTDIEYAFDLDGNGQFCVPEGNKFYKFNEKRN